MGVGVEAAVLVEPILKLVNARGGDEIEGREDAEFSRGEGAGGN